MTGNPAPGIPCRDGRDCFHLPLPGEGPVAEPLDRVHVTVGDTLPFDRAWAIENGRSKFDPAAPKHLPKIAFLMLMRNERLAALKTVFDEAARSLTVYRDGAVVAEGRLETSDGRQRLAAFFDGYVAERDARAGADRLRARPCLHRHCGKCLSLINLETVRDIERTLGVAVDPLRFRGNLYVDGLPAWAEFDWLGKTVAAGDVAFEAYARIDRCAATNVDPQTGERDLTLPVSLLQAYGHLDCGIYLRVTHGGALAAGTSIAPV